MKSSKPLCVSKLTLAIALCAIFLLTHTSHGWCEQPPKTSSVDCAELAKDLKEAKQLLADLREGMKLLLTEQAQYSTALNDFWDISEERELTPDEKRKEASAYNDWKALQTQIELLQNDIENQTSLVAVLEKDTLKYCTRFTLKKPFSTRTIEPLT